jgi:hypothetical protein
VSEGLAVFFETPDLDSPKGWAGMGRVNRYNLLQFHRWLRGRPANSLETLLLDDKPFRNPATAPAAYAQAWALNYYLLKRRGEEYVIYLKQLSALEPLVALEPAQRIALFKAAFGDDLARLEADWLRFMRTVD